MKVYSDLREIQKAELNILTEFANYCDNNDLHYCLAGGTLLGAVRHGGFIPWDDDIDVMMPRPDFERFIELAKGTIGNKYKVIWKDKSEHFPIPFLKLIDKNINVSYKLLQDPQSLWIDIFPIDGLPKEEKEFEQHVRKIKRLKYFLWQASSNEQEIGSTIKKIAKKILFFPFRLIGARHYADKITKTAKQYEFGACDYVGCIVAKYGKKERIEKEYVEERKTLSFEGIDFYVPKGYQIYLTNLYGDYNQIPKERHTHLRQS